MTKSNKNTAMVLAKGDEGPRNSLLVKDGKYSGPLTSRLVQRKKGFVAVTQQTGNPVPFYKHSPTVSKLACMS
jgi:hypothetical protein